jgi:hypothetical protein
LVGLLVSQWFLALGLVGFGWLDLVGFWLISNGPGQTHSKG